MKNFSSNYKHIKKRSLRINSAIKYHNSVGPRRGEQFWGKSTIINAYRGLGDSNQKTHTRYFGYLKYNVILGAGEGRGLAKYHEILGGVNISDFNMT